MMEGENLRAASINEYGEETLHSRNKPIPMQVPLLGLEAVIRRFWFFCNSG